MHSSLITREEWFTASCLFYEADIISSPLGILLGPKDKTLTFPVPLNQICYSLASRQIVPPGRFSFVRVKFIIWITTPPWGGNISQNGKLYLDKSDMFLFVFKASKSTNSKIQLLYLPVEAWFSVRWHKKPLRLQAYTHFVGAIPINLSGAYSQVGV